MAENLNKPGVYRGQQKLATQQDLALLRQEIRSLIAGPITEVSENGYIPWKYNTDGSLDIEYLFPELVQNFQENTGLSISRNGISFTNNIKSLNFTGNYVFLDIDENGKLVIDIRPPKQETSRFNDIDGVTDSIVRIRREILSGAIIPEMSTTNSVFGDWEPGSIHDYINWNRDQVYDPVLLSTNESIFASDLHSYFEIFVYDAYGTLIGTLITKEITGNKDSVEAASSGYSFHIKVKVSEFKEETNGFSFKPEFTINLIGLMGMNGGRFHFKIVHHDGNFNNSYISKDYLYNVGQVPVIGMHAYQVISDSSSSNDSMFKWCSGLKYISNGKINISCSEIKFLNKLAAVSDKMKYNFEFANKDLTKNSEKFESYTLNVSNVCRWITTLSLNEDEFINSASSGYVQATNAFGSSEKYNISIPLLLNSKENLPVSNLLNEFFSDEGFRVLNSFEKYTSDTGIWSNLVNWDSSQSLIDYDDGTGLMVTPSVGLSYPSGDWTSFIPAGSPNYNNYQFITTEKYFSRVFAGNERLKFGGIFVFKGMTRAQFDDVRFSCIISPDQGTTWYNLKEIRGVVKAVQRLDSTYFSTTGILTEIEETDDGIEVYWSYPDVFASSNPIYFKLGLKPTAPHLIKSISLINLDHSKEW